MKFIFKLVILVTAFLSSTAFGQESLDCPTGTVKSYVCKSTPQKDDNVIASELFDSITVCQKRGLKALLILVNDQEHQDADATVVHRSGGSSYKVDADDGVQVSLNVTTGVRSSKQIPAKLSVEFTESNLPPATSTYTCVR